MSPTPTADVKWMPLKTAIAAIARSLRTGKILRNSLTIQDRESGCFAILEINPTQGKTSVHDLSITMGKTEERAILFTMRQQEIDNLYAHWDTPGAVALLFVSGGRFTLLNINSKGRLTMVVGVDARKDEKPEDAAKHSDKRRVFYLVGAPE